MVCLLLFQLANLIKNAINRTANKANKGILNGHPCYENQNTELTHILR